MNEVIDLNCKRKEKKDFDDLLYFLDCSLDKDNVKSFISTLINKNMLYYFEEDALNVVNSNNQLLFSYKQALILNAIKNRIKDDPNLFSHLFNETNILLNLDFIYEKSII